MPRGDILIIRNVIDCFGIDSGIAFAPMIDPIPAMLAKHKELKFVKTTTLGSRVKLPGNNFYDHFFRYCSLTEKAIRKLFGFQRNFLICELYYWSAFFKRTNIKRVLCIEPTQSFLKICRDFSINVCEVQHGVIDLSSESLSHKDMTQNDLYPDYFLSWDRVSANKAYERSFYKTNPLIGCNMSLFHYLGNSENKDSNMLDGKSEDTSSKISVLVTLQWGMGESGPDPYKEMHLEGSYLPREVLDYMASSLDKYNYIFRLHPVSKKNKDEVKAIFTSLYSFGLVSSIEELELISDIPIYLQLMQVELHLTLYSSVTIESSYLGVPSILLDPALKKGRTREKHFENEINDGIAFIADINNMEESFEKALSLRGSLVKPIQTRFNECEKSLEKFLTLPLYK